MADRASVVDLIKLIEDAGYEARSYSGRGMYGKRCVGVTLERGQSAVDLILDCVEATPDDASELLTLLRHPSEDSLGLGTILYWPRLTWPEGLVETPSGDDDDEEDER